jgi:hypothetical protein
MLGVYAVWRWRLKHVLLLAPGYAMLRYYAIEAHATKTHKDTDQPSLVHDDIH